MNRRQFVQQSSFTIAALSFAQKNLLASWFDDPWKITMLTDRLGIFVEKGGTIAFLATKEGWVVVDAQFPEQSKHLIDELKKKQEQPFRLLINTHHHSDHTAGNTSFKGVVQEILAHENSKKNQEAVAIKNKTEDKQLYPNQTFGTIWCEKIGAEKICLHHWGAGHTNGDSFTHFQHDDIVHCGDLVFNRRHPYVDRSAGADMKNWIEVLDKALNKFSRKTKYVFGHSGNGYNVTGKADDLRKFQDYMGNTLKFVEAEIKSGKSREEILKATIIPGSEEWKGDGISRPLTAAFEELTNAN